ncbi:MAG: hypothetical protein AAF558_13225 [Verrucomicrobiota bacterium]
MLRSVVQALLMVGVLIALPADSCAEEVETLRMEDVSIRSKYPWKKNIVTTYFWIGQGSSGYNSMTNYKSAWDGSWTKNYGGEDCPKKRFSGEYQGKVSLPKTFAPTLNPFYVALPYNDIKYPKTSKKYVPWWDHEKWRKRPYGSQCKGRWVMIEYNGKVCFAQWEDVGPFRYDHAKYVFGDERPKIHSKAGLDVSPSVRDYLGLTGLNKTNWRFVEEDEVPYGPWIRYAEQAIVYSAIKSEAKLDAKNTVAANQESSARKGLTN